MTDPHDPAFTQPLGCGDVFTSCIGLTKRELFAALMMPQILNQSPCEMSDEQNDCGEGYSEDGDGHQNKCMYGTYDGAAAEAVRFADALIAALNEEKP